MVARDPRDLTTRPQPPQRQGLVLRNFADVSPEQLLERMIELSLYAEEKLKTR
jgi:hypothetical protein